MKLEWNVYRYDINKREIVVFNIFDHDAFNKGVMISMNEIDNYFQFAENVYRHLHYYFANRSEYEIVVKPNRKIDIYTQVTNNWEAFRDYLWARKLAGDYE